MAPVKPAVIETATTARSTFSISRHFDGGVVLLTGASGYIGSLVLEQLLRTTNVSAVMCLMRARAGQTATERLAKVTSGSLFHMVRDRSDIMSKVVAVNGDILMPGLGLSEEDSAELQARVDTIIHCAAGGGPRGCRGGRGGWGLCGPIANCTADGGGGAWVRYGGGGDAV